MNDCEHVARWAPISVVVVWMPGISRPRAIPAENDCATCTACSQLFDSVDAALNAKGIQHWTRAIVVFQDGRGADLRYRGVGKAMALA